jgi:hypothetical protein
MWSKLVVSTSSEKDCPKVGIRSKIKNFGTSMEESVGRSGPLSILKPRKRD